MDDPPVRTIDGDDGPTTSTVPYHIRCLTCEYDLKGLDAKGDCPECGSPIPESFNALSLALAGEAVMRRIERGAVIGVIGQSVVVIGAVPLIAAMLVRRSGTIMTIGNSPDIATLLGCAGLVIAGVGILMTCSAGILIGSRFPAEERHAYLPSVGDSLRRVCFVLAVLLFASAGAAIATTVSNGQVVQLIAIGFAIAFLLALIGAFDRLMHYLRVLTCRLPSRRLRRQTAIATWLIAAAVLFGAWFYGSGVAVGCVLLA